MDPPAAATTSTPQGGCHEGAGVETGLSLLVLNAGGGRAARTYLTAREKPWEGSEGCEEGDGGEVAGLAAALAPLAVDAAGAATGGGRPEAGPGQAPCLMAGGGAYDPSAPGADAPPLTAEEYLRRVRWEASQLPDVVVASQEQLEAAAAKSPSSASASGGSASKTKRAVSSLLPPPLPEVPSAVAASEAWEADFVADFSDLRLRVAAMRERTARDGDNRANMAAVPPSTDVAAWRKRCSNDGGSDGGSGAINAMLGASAPRCAAILRLLCGWVGDAALRSDDPSASAVDDADDADKAGKEVTAVSVKAPSTSSLGPLCAWIFAAAAVVDKPLDDDTTAALRSATRAAAGRLAAIAEGLSETESLEVRAESDVVSLNVVLAIAGGYFRQRG